MMNEMKVRLQKLIAGTGLASRRKAEELITAGRVTVNGTTVDLSGLTGTGVATLTAAGRLGEIRLSLARGTVFIATFGTDADEATATVRSLPMARWWDVDVYPIAAPSRGGAS